MGPKYHANSNQKKAGRAMLTLDRADLKVIRDKDGHYIMIKGSILQDTILNVYVPSNSVKLHEEKTDRTARRNKWLEA